MRIGLLGGSFNPAHAGHRMLAETARRHLCLDQVWLLVSPGNPLKPRAGMAPMAQRLASARTIAAGRYLVATGIEAIYGTRYTVDTMRRLLCHFPRGRFVWLMGADILVQLPHWRRWQTIVAHLPFVVLPRPDYTRPALAGPVAHRLRHARRPGRQAALLPGRAPGWAFMPGRENAISSTSLRAAGKGFVP